MDFWEQQAQARRRTRWLLPLFGLAVLATVVFNYLILAAFVEPSLKPVPHTSGHFYGPLSTAFLMLGELLVSPLAFLNWLWNPSLACWITVGTLLSITLGCLYKFWV